MTANDGALEMTEQDKADLASLNATPDGPDLAPYRTVLSSWQHLLSDAVDTESKKRVTAGWASRITSMYKQLTLQEMDRFRDLYFRKIGELGTILNQEIEADGECLNPTSVEEDLAENAVHYRNLIFAWQSQILGWELEWNCTDAEAHIEVAAISEVHRMFFGENGVTGHLDSIGFQFGEDDAQALTDHLESLKDEGDE